MQHNRNSKGNSGVLRSKSGSGSSSHAVVRRYEFYHFTGQYDPDSHEAICADGECNAPSAGEIGAFIGSQMAAANLQAQARITLDRTVVGAGGVVTASVLDGPAVAGDWLGLYDGEGALVTSYRDWKYLNGGHGKPAGGVANAAVTFTLPETPGIYTLRLFNSGTFNVAATSAPITVDDATPHRQCHDRGRRRDGHRDDRKCVLALPGDWIGLFDAASAAGQLPRMEIPERIARQAGGGHQRRSSHVCGCPRPQGIQPPAVRGTGPYAVVATSAHITVTASAAGTPRPRPSTSARRRCSRARR